VLIPRASQTKISLCTLEQRFDGITMNSMTNYGPLPKRQNVIQIMSVGLVGGILEDSKRKNQMLCTLEQRFDGIK